MDTPRRRWQRVDGLLLLDKPLGQSSNAALQQARRLFSAEKAGHTGTLDPLATGLLPILFGEATKFSSDLLDADKAYEATLRLGIRTETGDSEGQILEERSINVSDAALFNCLPPFRGAIQQIPPMYSALKRDGKPLYTLARQGLTVERAPRQVYIHALDVLEFSPPHCRIRVHCSKGTYIRTLAEDIGEALQCGAHLSALRRIEVGTLGLASAITLEALEALSPDARLAKLLPIDTLLSTLTKVKLESETARRFCCGNPIQLLSNTIPSGRCRVYQDTVFLGVGDYHEAWLKPVRLVATPTLAKRADKA